MQLKHTRGEAKYYPPTLNPSATQKWPPSHPCHFSPRDTVPSTYCIGGWVGPRTSLVIMEKNPSPLSGIEPRLLGCLAHSPVGILRHMGELNKLGLEPEEALQWEANIKLPKMHCFLIWWTNALRLVHTSGAYSWGYSSQNIILSMNRWIFDVREQYTHICTCSDTVWTLCPVYCGRI
jgi:hypothetical protein